MNAQTGTDRPRARLTQHELDAIMDRHALYIANRNGGQRAILQYRDMSGLTLAGRNLRDIDLTGSYLCHCHCADAIFQSAVMQSCDFTGSDLRKTLLERADLRGACLRGANLSGANMFDVDLRPAGLVQRYRNGELEAIETERNADLGGANFSGTNLTQARLTGALAHHTDFTDAVMRDVKLIRVDLRGAILKNADLSRADLTSADLRGANFTQAILIDTIMDYVEDAEADFSGTLTRAPSGIAFDDLHPSFDTRYRLHELLLTAHDGGNGELADLTGVDLRPAKSLAGAYLGALNAPMATLAGMDLRHARLQRANLEGADLRDCLLSGADLRGAILKNARLDRANLSMALLGPLPLISSPPIAANLSGVQARFADFTGTDLRYANLRDADLTGARLSGARLDQADTTDACMKNTVGMPDLGP